MDFPTQFHDVNNLLEEILENVQEILGKHFVGMYLFGSLTSGDFDQDSDIDVLVVIDRELTDMVIVELQAMHQQLASRDSLWAIQLEISYIPQVNLKRYDPAHANHLHLDRGSGEVLHWKQHGSDWIVQRYALRTRGIVVKGPALEPMIEPVSADDLRQAMRVLMTVWAVQLPKEPEWIRQRGGQSYTVLSMCRILYTLEYGDIISKPAAARWVQETLDPSWKPLIDRAWIGRHNPDLDAEPEDITTTLELVRYTLERSHTG